MLKSNGERVSVAGDLATVILLECIDGRTLTAEDIPRWSLL